MPGVARTVATLRVFGDNLDPDEVSALLGVEPTSGGKREGTRQGSWLFRASDSVPGDINAQLCEIFAQTTDDLRVWGHLKERFRVDVFCGLFMEGRNEGQELEADVLLALGQRGLRLGLDIYDPTPD